MAVSHLQDAPFGDGLYLRSVHRGVRPEVFRIDLIHDGQVVPFREEASPTLLRLVADGGTAEICFGDANELRVRGRGVGIRLTVPSFGAFAVPAAGKSWDLDSVPQDVHFMLTPLQGGISVDADWNGTETKHLVIDLVPSAEGNTVETAIEEFRTTWQGHKDSKSFEESLASVRSEYENWLATMPEVPEQYQDAANLAAYVQWSAVVSPEGYLTRPAMLMSKNWMNAVWSWDHCFNAMALIESHPELAWDQFMLLFDRQSSEGLLPDVVTDRQMTWAFTKPPIHGLTLAWLMSHGTVSRKQLEEVYGPLAKWTEWYFRYRDDDHDGLPQYDHGNDSGWDNSTVFRTGPGIETPELAAYLVIQMQTLADVASRLGRREESQKWASRAQALLKSMTAAYWRDGRFVALRASDHEVMQADSLLLYLPIVLGKQLPEEIRVKLLADLKQPGAFLTAYGLASEKPQSQYYEADGYWRGPIWASSTFLMVEGVEASGDHAFAQDLRRRFCDMNAKSGFAENYDATTGRSLRDPAYTWSASVFLVFAHQLLQP